MLRHRGFTLIELMITVAVVAILAAIAVPAYREQVRRGAVEEGLAALSSGRVAVEQYFLDNRTYVGSPCPTGSVSFPITCQFAAARYTLTATGAGTVAGFIYTLNETGARATTGGAWGTGTCWIARKGDVCP